MLLKVGDHGVLVLVPQLILPMDYPAGIFERPRSLLLCVACNPSLDGSWIIPTKRQTNESPSISPSSQQAVIHLLAVIGSVDDSLGEGLKSVEGINKKLDAALQLAIGFPPVFQLDSGRRDGWLYWLQKGILGIYRHRRD